MPQTEFTISVAGVSDAPEILLLQRLAFQTEAEVYGTDIAALRQSLDELKEDMLRRKTFKAVKGNVIIGSVRARLLEDGSCRIGALMTHPDFRRRGVAKELIRAAEEDFKRARRFELFTGAESHGNIKLYESLGYRIYGRGRLPGEKQEMVFMERHNSPTA